MTLAIKDLNHTGKYKKIKEVKNHLKLHHRELAVVNVFMNNLPDIFVPLHRILHIFYTNQIYKQDILCKTLYQHVADLSPSQ